MTDREWDFFMPILGILILYFFLASFEVIFIWIVVWTAVKVWFIEGRDWSVQSYTEPQETKEESKQETQPEIQEEQQATAQ